METTTNLHECIINRIESGMISHPLKTPDLVISLLLGYFGKSESDIKQRCRKAELVWPRQVIMVAIRIECEMGTQQTGELFGLDHSTVINSTKVITELARFNRAKRNQLIEMCKLLRLYRFLRMIEGVKFHQKIRFE